MDVDLVKSATEDQMEMMMMLMQMDKLPAEFLGPHMESITEMPSVHYASNGTGLNINMNSTSSIFSNFESPNPDSPTLVNHLSSASFMGNAVQEPMMSNSSSMRHMGGELSSGGNSSISKRNSMAAMREMIFRIAAMQPIHIDPESVKPPKRRNVKISKDPQSVAARHRRERISERIRILQRLVPGGTKMDTASMLDEAIHYVKFLKTQVQSLEQVAVNSPMGLALGALSNGGNHHSSAASMAKGYHHHHQLPAGGHQGFNSNSTHQMLN